MAIAGSDARAKDHHMTTTAARPSPPVKLVPPRLRRTPVGWLAVSPSGARLKFAVTGATEDDAMRQYAISYREWRDIQSR